jgi:hypothetical protein
MLPYFFLLLISAVLPLGFYQRRNDFVSVYDEYVYRKRNKMTITLFFLFLFLLMALRHISVGYDLLNYKMFFQKCYMNSFGSLAEEGEIGYTIYNILVASIFKNYRFFLIVTAAVILFPVYNLYLKEEKYGFLLIVLFVNMPCFLMMFSGLRQAIAVSIGVLAYMAMEKKKYVWSVLLILLAGSFHISSYILFLLFPAFFLKIKTKHLFVILPAMVAVYLFRVPLLKMLLRFLPEQYLHSYGKIEQTGAFGMTVLFMIFFAFSFIVLDESVMEQRYFCIRNILLIATILQFFVPVHGLIQRASYYFLIFVPISLVRVVQAPRKMWQKVSDMAVIVLTCFFFVYFFYHAVYSPDNLLGVFPYKSLWSEQAW